jgi:hypothetical protein
MDVLREGPLAQLAMSVLLLGAGQLQSYHITPQGSSC